MKMSHRECVCKYVMRVDDSYIPDYSRIAGTGDPPGTPLIGVIQYECLCCGTRWGYVPGNAKVVPKPDRDLHDTLVER